MKDLLYGKNTIFLRDTAGNPERAKYRNLDNTGSQSQRRIKLILFCQGASHIIINDTI